MGEEEPDPQKDYMDCIQLGKCFHKKDAKEDLEDYNEKPMFACDECNTW